MVAFEPRLRGAEGVSHAGIWARGRGVRRDGLGRGPEDSWCVGK